MAVLTPKSGIRNVQKGWRDMNWNVLNKTVLSITDPFKECLLTSLNCFLKKITTRLFFRGG